MHKLAISGLISLLLALTACQTAPGAVSAPTPKVIALPTSDGARLALSPTASPTPTEVISVAATPTPAASAARRPAMAPTAERTSPGVMVIGAQPLLVLRSGPSMAASVVATVPGAQVTWAEGRNANATWLWVAYDDAGARAWILRDDVQVWGEAAELPVIGPAAPAIPVAASGAPGGAAGRVQSGPVNVRGGPGLDQAVIGQAVAGQVVTPTGRSREGDWLAIAWDGGTGWIATSLVAIGGDVGALPELAVQTTGVTRPSAASSLDAGLGGKLVFQTATGGDIYIVNADGSGFRRLTDGIDPVLSPDGTRVAYARWGAPHGVFILDLRTGAEQRIASVNRPRGPTWSPDGLRVAFTHVTRTRTCVDLGFACVDIDELRRMLGGQECIDTPEGRRCIGDFPLINIDDNGLALADPASGSRDNLISEGSIQSAEWHPSRGDILFRGKPGLQAIQPGQQPSPVANNPSLSSAVWSPDGQRMAAQIRIHDRTEIVLLDAGGNVSQYLTQPPPTYERPGQPAPDNVAPAWSPDGRSLVFFSNRDGAWRPYIMKADGANQRLFLPGVLGQLTFRYDFAAERMVNWGE